MTGIGAKIEQNMRLQEFVEKCMAYMASIAEDDDIMQDIMDEMDATEDEIVDLFAELDIECYRYSAEDEEE